MTIKVVKKDNESGEKLLRRFSGHVKSLKMQQKFRAARYNKPEPTKTKVRASAVVREEHRAENKRKLFLS